MIRTTRGLVEDESGIVEIVLPSGTRTDGILAHDGDREYLWLDGIRTVDVGDRLLVRDRPARVTHAAQWSGHGRPTTVARIRGDHAEA